MTCFPDSWKQGEILTINFYGQVVLIQDLIIFLQFSEIWNLYAEKHIKHSLLTSLIRMSVQPLAVSYKTSHCIGKVRLGL